MSYILDALQRAEAERERGQVPGLKSQIVPTAGRKPTATRRWRPLHTVALAIALLGAAVLWWWLHEAEPAPRPAPSPAAVPEAPVASAPVEAPPPATAPVSATPEPALPILAPPRVEPPPRRSATPAPAPSPGAGAAPAPGTTPSTAGPPAVAAPSPTPAPAIPPASAASPVRSFAELSPEARAQLPAVNVSGSTYSKNPALRMLIVNGKVLQEGQEIAPGLKLETIGERSAVLNHNGLRYSIGY